MNDTVVYIGEDMLDLLPGTLVASTLKANDIGDLTTRFSNYTNVFRVPFTENNNRIYQYSNDVRSKTILPYRKQLARVVQNGVEIIRDGLHFIRKSTDKYEVYIISGSADFFDVVGEKLLVEINDHPSITTIGYVRGDLRNNTTGVSDAVMDQGNFYIDSGVYHLNEENAYITSMYYHTIIDRIIADAGYQKAGNIFSNDKYLNMAVLCSGSNNTRWAYSTLSTTRQRAEAINEDGIVTNSGSTIAMPFETVLLNDSGQWEGSAGRYNISHPFVSAGVQVIRLEYIITITVDSFNSAGTFRLGVSRDGAAPVIQHRIDISSPGTYVLNTSGGGVIGAVGEYHEIQLIPISGTPEAVISFGKIIVRPTESLVGGANTARFFNRLLPQSISQKDFIKHFLITFGLIIYENNGVLYFKGIDEIINSKHTAKDWTEKRDTSEYDDISFTPLSYSQNNYFKYSNVEDVEEDGIGNLVIDNDNAPLQSTIYTAPFTSSDMIQIGDIFMMSVPIYEIGVDVGGSTFQHTPGLRIFLIRDKYSFEPDIEFFFGGTFSDYRVAYFNDPEQQHTARFQQFLDNNYRDLSSALQAAKILKRRYILSEKDIADITFLDPVFDTDSYLLLNSVKNFVPGKLTEVELFKIS